MAEHHATPKAGSGDLVKIVFELSEYDEPELKTESMWAKPLGHDRYRLRNVPFYAYGVSYDDTVIAKPRQGELVVQGISQPGGHSTYRLFLSEQTPDITDRNFVKFWSVVERLGGTYERATARLFSVDVPPEANIHKVYEALQQGETAQVWEFEEAHCGHPI
jgi:hypothetical protein